MDLTNALDPGLVRLLPGIWALLLGLGVFASRPYLARAAGWVGLLAAAVVLHLDIPRVARG